MECKKCGAYLPDDAEYCTECGEPVTKDNIEYFDDEREQEDQDLNVPSLSSSREAELQAIKERRNQKRKREKRNKIILIAIIAVIAAGGIGYGIYSIRENWIGNNTVIETPRPSSTATAEPIASPSPGTSPEVSPVPEATPDENGVIPTAGAAAGQNGGTQQGGETASGTSNSASAGGGSSSIRTVKPSSGSASSGSGSGTKTSRPSGGTQGTSGSGSSGASSGTSNVPKTMNPVKMGSTMVNQNIKGKEIAVDASTGRRLFVFTIGNDSFLANIDNGTTTEMVRGQYYTIDAAPSGEEYAGLPVYEITSIFKYTDYILPESDKRILSESEVSKLSKKQLALARNEIFARHGRAFSNSEYKAYFASKPWYKVNKNFNYDNESSNLSDIEKANLITIINCENKK